MIQIEEISIRNFRGIRSLDLRPNRKPYAIQGANGTGKSCVVDAIEFGLTGNISRLSGKGAGDLSVGAHGAHVDSRNTTDASSVTLKLYLTNLDRSVTICRTVKSPSKPSVKPNSKDVLDTLAKFGKRDEITLTRRQILKYITTPATERALSIQNLLRLDEIGKTRKVFMTAANSCKKEEESAKSVHQSALQKLQSQFGIGELTKPILLDEVNKRRSKLGLEPISNLDAESMLPVAPSGTVSEKPQVIRSAAARELGDLRKGIASPTKAEIAGQMLAQLATLDADPKLLTAVNNLRLIEDGLALTMEDKCPLCDSFWKMDDLRLHLQEKQRRSENASAFTDELLNTALTLQTLVRQRITEIRAAISVAVAIGKQEVALALENWAATLQANSDLLSQVEGIRSLRERFATFYDHSHLLQSLDELELAISLLPDPSIEVETSSFLAVAQELFAAVRQSQNSLDDAKRVSRHASFAYKCYCEVSEAELESLYKSVEESFARYYRALHGDDESSFSAKLDADEGKLDLSVDFFGRGKFHPSAYHSEGHQDSMGLCLYLALMRQVFGDDLNLVVLDDVVMSVDCGHRREICRLLVNHFPDTQFIITTHEETWFKQMQSSGLIDRNSGAIFQAWSVEDGPRVSGAIDTWDRIAENLKQSNIPAACAALRRHIEYASRELADGLGAEVTYRADGSYQAGEILPKVKKRLLQLLNESEKAEQAWGHKEQAAKAKTHAENVEVNWKAIEQEGWLLNSAIHYNEWANLVQQDIQRVVEAYQELLRCFRCTACNSWLYQSPRSNRESVKCDCDQTRFNLKKPKSTQKTESTTTAPGR